jgi:hypothetical protein
MQYLKKLLLMKISGLIILLVGLSLSGCTGYLVGSTTPADMCFTGKFSDGHISLQVVHNGGSVTASGWREPATSVPWDYLFFNGHISRVGESRGEITLYILPHGTITTITETTISDRTLSLPDDRECAIRNSLIFSLDYTLEGVPHGENYNLTREP